MLYPATELVFSAGAVVFDAKRERVLTIVCQKDPQGIEEIGFPKGQVEDGETIEAAARREVEEETGAKCELWPKLMAMESRYNAQIGKTKIIYWYAASLLEMCEQRLEDYEKFTTRWVDVDKARSVLSFENDRKLVDICLSAAVQK